MSLLRKTAAEYGYSVEYARTTCSRSFRRLIGTRTRFLLPANIELPGGISKALEEAGFEEIEAAASAREAHAAALTKEAAHLRRFAARHWPSTDPEK